MQKIEIGSHLPTIMVELDSGKTTDLAEIKDKNLVIYFYPKDNTPGCTLEAEGFRDHIKDFEKKDTVVIGVSRDSTDSHDKFINQCDIPFDLISDPNEELCKLFDVIRPKNLYGREYMGVERSTFLIDKEGVVRKEWRNVNVNGHVEEVLEAVQDID